MYILQLYLNIPHNRVNVIYRRINILRQFFSYKNGSFVFFYSSRPSVCCKLRVALWRMQMQIL